MKLVEACPEVYPLQEYLESTAPPSRILLRGSLHCKKRGWPPQTLTHLNKMACMQTHKCAYICKIQQRMEKQASDGNYMVRQQKENSGSPFLYHMHG